MDYRSIRNFLVAITLSLALVSSLNPSLVCGASTVKPITGEPSESKANTGVKLAKNGEDTNGTSSSSPKYVVDATTSATTAPNSETTQRVISGNAVGVTKGDQENEHPTDDLATAESSPATSKLSSLLTTSGDTIGTTPSLLPGRASSLTTASQPEYVSTRPSSTASTVSRDFKMPEQGADAEETNTSGSELLTTNRAGLSSTTPAYSNVELASQKPYSMHDGPEDETTESIDDTESSSGETVQSNEDPDAWAHHDDFSYGAEQSEHELDNEDQDKSFDRDWDKYYSEEHEINSPDSETHGEASAAANQQTAPVVENVQETYIDDSDPTDPKQVYHSKQVKSLVDPNGHSYAHSETKTSNSIGANPNKYSKHQSHISSSSSSSYSNGPVDSNYPPTSTKRKSNKKKRRNGRKDRRNRHKQYYQLPYNYEATRTPYPIMPAMPAMPPMPAMPTIRIPSIPKIPQIPRVIQVPLGALSPMYQPAHAQRMPQVWQNVPQPNHGLGFGQGYSPAYPTYQSRIPQVNSNMAYAYSSVGPVGGPDQGSGYFMATPDRMTKREPRSYNRQAEFPQDQFNMLGALPFAFGY